MAKVFVLVVFSALTASARCGSKASHDSVEGLGNILKKFLDSQPRDVKISDGVHLVSTRSDNDGRAIKDDGTFLGAVENYLQSHEIRIRLPELMPGKEFGRSLRKAYERLDEENEISEARGGGGGGGGGKGGGGMGGGVMMLGLMMGKMLAALGIGGVGLLAMKALMVSALALLLSVIIGLKKLVHSDHDEGGHTVIHATGHGHGHHDYRKKREAADMAYKAWNPYEG